ncbi:MAG: hypothetical protein RIQ33_603 [Bacteroidota bacterium]|jgi:hypothetical protein
MRFEQQPPIPEAYYVQKLPQATSEGNNIIFSVKFLDEPNLPNKLFLNPIENQNLVLQDDGNYPDEIAGDLKYTTLMREDLQLFTNKIHALEDEINADGGVINFTGHDGHFTKPEELVHFDFQKFENNEETQVEARLIAATDCTDEIKKEKSLFITDISVVEDPVRTYNFFTNQGNKQGAWTFGHLLGNIINNPNNVNAFIENWVSSFTVQQTNTTSGDIAYTRPDVKTHLMAAWIIACYSDPLFSPTIPKTASQIKYDITNNVSGSDWHYYVNQIPGNILLDNAPFKLTAIVNRMDLRGNNAFATAGYSNGSINMTNAGETRFIFSLLNVDDDPTLNYSILPTHGNIGNSGESFFDWKGMNVILEYSNPQPNLELLQGFANTWVQLSGMPFNSSLSTGNNNYNDNLQYITDIVTRVNAMPQRINGSAINRIRTNEKIFDLEDNEHGITFISWVGKKWEFRQFELASNGLLEPVPVTNVPYFGVNDAEHSPNETSNQVIGHFDSQKSQTFLNWVSQNSFHIEQGNFQIPKNLSAMSAPNYSELINYFVFDQNYYNSEQADYNLKKVRHEISLNTCQGCHGGETKTEFTMITPMVYGQYADYWSSAPVLGSGYLSVPIDARDYFNSTINNNGSGNTGGTFEQYLFTQSAPSHVSNNYKVEAGLFKEQKTIPTLSPFLTGRRFNKIANPVPPNIPLTIDDWADDNNDPADLKDNLFSTSNKFSDKLMEGLFYVNDPDNHSPLSSNSAAIGGSPYNHDTKYMYNDLEMRKKDICSFLLDEDASSGNVLRTMHRLGKNPLPLGAH